jgi:hypothetical protein
VIAANAGGYSVVVTNAHGSVTSQVAMLTMNYLTTSTVTSLADGVAGSLRDTMAYSTAGDSIVFGVTGTITLASGELVVAKDLAIIGPGTSALTINGAAASRIFNINSNVTALISGLTVTNGRAPKVTDSSPGDPGGGIYNAGSLSVSNCVIAGNAGGGIYNVGALRLDNSILSGNTTEWDGGGLWNGGTCFANLCWFSSNLTASGSAGIYYNQNYSSGGGPGRSGGGIFNGSVMALTNCTLRDNRCGRGGAGGGGYFQGGGGGPGGSGGGIYSTNSLTLIGCTIVSNGAGSGGNGGYGQAAGGFGGYGGGGGGIFSSGSLVLTNCTLAGNSCGDGGVGGSWPNIGGAGGSGGGICGEVTVVSCTIVSNTAGMSGGGSSGGAPVPDGSGGGVYVPGSGRFLSDIVAGNAARNNGQGPDCSGAITSLGHNLIGVADGSSGFNAPGDLAGSQAAPFDPKLAPLADNGGPTLTLALTVHSPAIDAGAAVGTPATDQRGVVRPQGSGVDIGAYEYEFVCKITDARFQSTSNFWLQACGLPNQAYTLQISTNLLNWSDVTNLTTDIYGVGECVDCDAGQWGPRFYRLKRFPGGVMKPLTSKDPL